MTFEQLEQKTKRQIKKCVETWKNDKTMLVYELGKIWKNYANRCKRELSKNE